MIELICTQAFFDANPGFVDRFPGGIVQFLQMAGELPADALEDIMIAEVMGNEGQNINMPGAMPDQEPLFAEFTDEEDEADDDADAPTDGHIRAEAQNVRNLQNVDSDRSNDDEEDSEAEEVAVSLPLHRVFSALLIYHSNDSPCQCA